MTREEKFMAMRGKDLVQYCLDNGIKVSQSRGILKEARADVVKRILDAEQNGITTVDSLLEELRNLPGDAKVDAIMAKVNELDVEDRAKFYQRLAEF